MAKGKSKGSTSRGWSFWKVVAVILIVIAAFFLINWYTVRVFGWDMFSWLIEIAHNPPDLGGP